MSAHANPFELLLNLVFRLQMRMAAFLLRRDYNRLQEFNALDGEDFIDEYIFDAQNFYGKHS